MQNRPFPTSHPAMPPHRPGRHNPADRKPTGRWHAIVPPAHDRRHIWGEVADLSWIADASLIARTVAAPVHGRQFRPTVSCFSWMIVCRAAAVPTLRRP
jgi:hypothetical protein